MPWWCLNIWVLVYIYEMPPKSRGGTGLLHQQPLVNQRESKMAPITYSPPSGYLCVSHLDPRPHHGACSLCPPLFVHRKRPAGVLLRVTPMFFWLPPDLGDFPHLPKTQNGSEDTQDPLSEVTRGTGGDTEDLASYPSLNPSTWQPPEDYTYSGIKKTF